MTKIYIAIEQNGAIHLINTSPEKAKEAMIANGWTVYDLGFAGHNTMPGRLATIAEIDGRFAQNLEVLQLKK